MQPWLVAEPQSRSNSHYVFSHRTFLIQESAIPDHELSPFTTDEGASIVAGKLMEKCH
jgi:hypothetical protein